MEASQSPAWMATLHAEWLSWANLPWLMPADAGAADVQFGLRLIESASQVATKAEFLKQELPEIASEFAAQWVGVFRDGEGWERLAEFGRQPVQGLPHGLLAQALERDAAGSAAIGARGNGDSWNFCAAPLHGSIDSNRVLVLCGRGLGPESLPAVLATAWALGWSLEVTDRRELLSQETDRLRTTLRIASQLNATRETKPLVEMIATEAARMLNADRCSIFTWDREHHELVGSPTAGTEGPLRLPDNVGIVGECVRSGMAIAVDDAHADLRFDRQVDAESESRTHSLLCVPIIDTGGRVIGALEAIKRNGHFTARDEQSLAELGVPAAAALANTREREHLVRRHLQLTQQVTQGVAIVGQSPSTVALRTTVERLASTDLPVLILGPAGTDKEVVGQSLHYQGSRRDHPFVAVNCAAVSEISLEGELFGHESRACIDARETHQGKFELAEGGTLFLNEIGNLSAGIQAKLLCILEQNVFTRVGGTQPIRTNARVVAATNDNDNLVQAVASRKFSEDLFYRLSAVTLQLPPLRERHDDILPLAEHFLESFCRQARRPRLAIAPNAQSRLVAHPWPGNVRELRNLMERMAFLCPGERIEASDLAFILSPDRDTASGATDLGLTEATNRFQQDYIRRMIKRAQGNMTETARLLGMHRSNLYRKMRLLEMSEASDSDA
jgi:Nif-specific regulatory protein